MKHPIIHFNGMKQRCYNEKFPTYKSYGAKGIGICTEWLDDKNSFVQWAFDTGWQPGYHIHRKDSQQGYSPENCVWLSSFEHTTLHSDSRLCVHDGMVKYIIRKIPDDLHKALKHQAIEEGKTLNQIIIEILTSHMQKGGCNA